MSKVSLDLKQFQHVKSDDKTTTLRHKDGHELTIAHKALSPEYQEQLKALHTFAEGGAVDKHFDRYKVQHEGLSDKEHANKATEIKHGINDNVHPDLKASRQKKHDYHAANSKRNYMSDGGEAKPTGRPDATPDAHPEKYEQTISNGWSNIKKAFEAEGGELEAPDMRPIPDAAKQDAQKRKEDRANETEDYGQPLVKFKKMYADGTDNVQPGGPQEEQSNAPEEVPDQTAQPQQATQAPDQGLLGAKTQLQADPQAMAQANQAAQPPPPVAPQTAQTQQQPPVDPITQYKNDFQNDVHQEGLAYQADRTNGHIEAPHMMQDKSTLSKLGTLFGLIVGGAGSGLSGQPNLAFQAMQNQLDRDFKAQMTSADNAQNYFRLNQQNLSNQSNIQMTNTEKNIKAAANARIQMNWDALDALTKENSKLPEGSPARRSGDAVLAMLNDQVQKGNFSIGSQAATAAAQAKLLGLTGAPGQGGTNVTAMKVLGGDKGRTMADEIENKTISGIPEVAGQKAARPITEQARNTITAMKTLDDKTKDLFNFINQHKGMDLTRLSPKVRAVAQQKLEEVKNFYNSSIQGGALTEGRLGWYDKQFGKGAPTDILPQLMGQTDKFKEISDSNHTRMNTQLQSMGFNPKNTKSGASQAQDTAAQKKQAAAPQEEVRMVNNKAAVFNPSTKQFIRWK